jgi:predicted esterase
MKCSFLRRTAALICCGLHWVTPLTDTSAADGPGPAKDPQGPASEVRFSQPAPYGSDLELMRHLGFKLPVPGYSLDQEKFRMIIPETYSTNRTWGLLVWISPGDDPRVPGKWFDEFARQKLLFVAPCGAGNERHTIQRCRLVLDAVCNACRRYAIDPRRIYVAGFSGGGRIASILGVAYGDVFAGALPMCGADYFRNVQGPPGQFYPASYRPDPRVLQRSKSLGHFVLLTGEKDANRDNTRCVAENGFRRDGFKHVKYMEVAGMGHTMPSAAVLKTALESLAGGQP